MDPTIAAMLNDELRRVRDGVSTPASIERAMETYEAAVAVPLDDILELALRDWMDNPPSQQIDDDLRDAAATWLEGRDAKP